VFEGERRRTASAATRNEWGTRRDDQNLDADLACGTSLAAASVRVALSNGRRAKAARRAHA